MSATMTAAVATSLVLAVLAHGSVCWAVTGSERTGVPSRTVWQEQHTLHGAT
jgi:hypothetical protein